MKVRRILLAGAACVMMALVSVTASADAQGLVVAGTTSTPTGKAGPAAKKAAHGYTFCDTPFGDKGCRGVLTLDQRAKTFSIAFEIGYTDSGTFSKGKKGAYTFVITAATITNTTDVGSILTGKKTKTGFDSEAEPGTWTTLPQYGVPVFTWWAIKA